MCPAASVAAGLLEVHGPTIGAGLAGAFQAPKRRVEAKVAGKSPVIPFLDGGFSRKMQLEIGDCPEH